MLSGTHRHDEISGSRPEAAVRAVTGRVFDIQRYSTKDGPGVRTTVFLKGCPLRCHWCSNPESQKKAPELMFFSHRCIKCHSCLAVCPHGANALDLQGNVVVDRERCLACGLCADVCQGNARRISGKLMTADEVMEILKKDTLFYRNSGGGITLSGGEPTQQAEFATELLRNCQRAGFHTTLDTCGYGRWDVMQEILEYVDLVFFDIKHMDDACHKELTGVSNKLILENAERIALAGTPMEIRFPVIPGCNDSMSNIERLGEYVSSLGVRKIDLLPYHQFALQKYESLSVDYRLRDTAPPPQEKIRGIMNLLESYGLEVSVVV